VQLTGNPDKGPIGSLWGGESISNKPTPSRRKYRRLDASAGNATKDAPA
jgi:hypothetical protein